MDIWMALLKVLIGVVSFFVLFAVLFGIEWIFEKLFIFLEECQFGYIIDKIFRILENSFTILIFVIFGILLILLIYETGDVLWKLI